MPRFQQNGLNPLASAPHAHCNNGPASSPPAYCAKCLEESNQSFGITRNLAFLDPALRGYNANARQSQ
jgi:hypothetical protein